MITQDVTKDEKAQGVKGNILGNGKVFWVENGQAPQQANQNQGFQQQAPQGFQQQPQAVQGFSNQTPAQQNQPYNAPQQPQGGFQQAGPDNGDIPF
jgi:hypothetical protein